LGDMYLGSLIHPLFQPGKGNAVAEQDAHVPG
jgi:hypothetical protein